MKQALHKRSILRKTFQVGGFTLLSRLFGIIREILMVRYLGVSGVSDAFFTAFKIPNSLRKIFAEGALSATFIPTFVQLVRNKEMTHANRLMTFSFLFFEGIVLLLCLMVMIKPLTVLQLIAPGFSTEQIHYAVPYLRILMPFIFFISSSALLAGALQAVHRFTIPAFAPVFLNILFIGCLLMCLYYQLPVTVLCWGILGAGFLQFLIHVIAYMRLEFSFAWMNKTTWNYFRTILVRFVPCLFSMSIVEIGLFIDTSFASYLPDGTISLLYYANRFMGIPLGVFGVAFSTVLLPHFSHVGSYAPKRLPFYLLESAKLIWWVMIPISIMMIFFAHDIFYTLFLSEKFSVTHVDNAALLLQIQVIGLFFFAFNKIIMNVYYALQDTFWPMIVSILATGCNIVGNVLVMRYFGAPGLVGATTISTIIQTSIFLYLLYHSYRFVLYVRTFLIFALRYALQLCVIMFIAWTLFSCIRYGIMQYVSPSMQLFLLQKIGLWFWVGPLACGVFIMLYVTRTLFNVELYFLERR